jgi:ectoine hydroxylase-related dioxygenase (phytanoyl-CoA dioxygenase family)
MTAHGVVVFREVLTEGEVATLREVLAERAKVLTRDVGAARFWCESHMSTWSPVVRDVVLSGHVPALVAQALGAGRLWLYEDTALVKEVGDAPGTQWHQDVVHYPVRGSVATAWISLDDVDERNGVVRYVPGSHSLGTLFEPVRFSDGRRFGGVGLAPMPDIDLSETVSFSTRPGDVIVHDGLIVHGSPDQYIHRRRRALAASYVGDDVVYHDTPFPYRHPIAAGDRFTPTDHFQDLLEEARLR